MLYLHFTIQHSMFPFRLNHFPVSLKRLIHFRCICSSFHYMHIAFSSSTCVSAAHRYRFQTVWSSLLENRCGKFQFTSSAKHSFCWILHAIQSLHRNFLSKKHVRIYCKDKWNYAHTSQRKQWAEVCFTGECRNHLGRFKRDYIMCGDWAEYYGEHWTLWRLFMW